MTTPTLPDAPDGFSAGEYLLAVPAAEHAPLAGFLPEAASLTAPYRGISPFRLVDAPIFFARAEEIIALAQCVAVYRGVLLYGESGVGKSSLINAGFIPAAIRQGYRPERLRVRPVKGSEILVERISTSAVGGAPYLPSIFAPAGGDGTQVTLSVEALAERLRTYRPAERSPAEGGWAVRPPSERPLLIFDQFEESITLFEEARADDASAALELQGKLFDTIAGLLTDHTLPVKVVLSFREDYLAKLSKLFQRVPELTDHSVRVIAPDVEHLPTIIQGPLQPFLADPGSERSARAERMMKVVPALEEEFRKRVGGGQLVLTEVQIACAGLWEAPDPEALLKQGVQKILERFLDDALEVYRRPEVKDAAIALLSCMVTDAGTRNIVSETNLLQEVEDETGVGREQLKEILDDFDGRRTRLVWRERPRGIPFYTIVSEFLVPRIRVWRAQRESERRWARLRKRILMGAGAVLVLGLALGAVLNWVQQNQIARQQADIVALESQRRADSLAHANAVKDSSLLAREAELREASNRISQLDQGRDSLTSRTDSLRQALDAGQITTQVALLELRRINQSLDLRLGQALAEADSLRKLGSINNASLAAALERQRDSLQVVQTQLRVVRAELREVQVERDSLVASRENWLPAVRHSRESSDDDERKLAEAVCRADVWHCSTRPKS